MVSAKLFLSRMNQYRNEKWLIDAQLQLTKYFFTVYSTPNYTKGLEKLGFSLRVM
jgi:hypothetical protein